MARKKSKTKIKEPEKLIVQCPVRGHVHKLELIPSPDRPDLVVGYCGDRLVYQAANPDYKLPVENETQGEASSSYFIPRFEDSEQDSSKGE